MSDIDTIRVARATDLPAVKAEGRARRSKHGVWGDSRLGALVLRRRAWDWGDTSVEAVLHDPDDAVIRADRAGLVHWVHAVAERDGVTSEVTVFTDRAGLRGLRDRLNGMDLGDDTGVGDV